MLALAAALTAAAATSSLAVGPRPPTGDAGELAPAFLEAVKARGVKLPEDRLGRRILAEYGALFVSCGAGVVFPPVYRWAGQDQLARFQASAHPTTVTLGRTKVELQPAAARALETAVAEGQRLQLKVSARGGASAARRSYAEAAGFWQKRVEGGLAHWTRTKALSKARAAAIRAMTLDRQIEAVLEEEDRGHFFASSLDKTVMRSTAPPGSSQHHAMLALDVEEYASEKVRALLARHGWFQTVISDLPHFTYLGAREAELPALGLTPVHHEGRVWWIPARRSAKSTSVR